MKKCLALIAALLLCLECASAAEWAEGRSAAQPYAGVQEVDLGARMGYSILWPSAKLPMDCYCDTLTIYLPREDVALGQGKLTLMNEEGPVAEAEFSDPAAVTLRPMDEDELVRLLWGGGVAIEVKLPVSLSLHGGEYVEMEEGCFTAAAGKVRSLRIQGDPNAWRPTLAGEFGVGSVRYTSEPEGEEEAPPKAAPEEGDIVTFELLLGGGATTAVVYSPNESVQTEAAEYTESGVCTGRVLSADVNWGVLFLNENGEVLDSVAITR